MVSESAVDRLSGTAARGTRLRDEEAATHADARTLTQGRVNKPADSCYSFWIGASLQVRRADACGRVASLRSPALPDARERELDLAAAPQRVPHAVPDKARYALRAARARTRRLTVARLLCRRLLEAPGHGPRSRAHVLLSCRLVTGRRARRRAAERGVRPAGAHGRLVAHVGRAPPDARSRTAAARRLVVSCWHAASERTRAVLTKRV